MVNAAAEALFYDDTASDGTRQLVYYQPVIGRPWAIVLTVPAQQAQQLALNIAMPLSLMIIYPCIGGDDLPAGGFARGDRFFAKPCG